MNELFSYYAGGLEDFIVDALITKGTLIKRVISNTTPELVNDLRLKGVNIDVSWKHTLDNNAVRHIINSHGTSMEELRGQVCISTSDLLIIPEIINSYDTLTIEMNRRGQDIIIYSKILPVEEVFYVEEVRIGRRELAASTMYKRKKENSPTQMD